MTKLWKPLALILIGSLIGAFVTMKLMDCGGNTIRKLKIRGDGNVLEELLKKD